MTSNTITVNFGAHRVIPKQPLFEGDILEEGFMFPGLYDGIFQVYHKINNPFWKGDEYLSSGFCLANPKDITTLENSTFNARLVPCTKLAFKKRGLINCISYNSPNVLGKKRPSISIALVKISMEDTSGPKISYFGSTGTGLISACPLKTASKVGYLLPSVVETESPVNQLYFIDLNENQCGRIEVDNILVELNEAVGIYVRVNSIIEGSVDSK